LPIAWAAALASEPCQNEYVGTRPHTGDDLETDRCLVSTRLGQPLWPGERLLRGIL